jgi:hypothetical protein
MEKRAYGTQKFLGDYLQKIYRRGERLEKNKTV